ncbi:hypothetical protein CB1_000389001 [Camelus ferus]|nr:hypothetical protein CB1_000389001 [Camelus ferus]
MPVGVLLLEEERDLAFFPFRGPPGIPVRFDLFKRRRRRRFSKGTSVRGLDKGLKYRIQVLLLPGGKRRGLEGQRLAPKGEQDFEIDCGNAAVEEISMP